MKKKFKKRLRLKKEVIIFNKICICLLFILFMQHSSFLKLIIKSIGDNLEKDNYQNKYEKAIIALGEKKDKNNKKSDELFLIKEEKNEKPLIYIYNTHQTEKYLNNGKEYEPTVLHASKYLGERFNKGGLSSIVENKSISNILNVNGWSYGSSYKVSRLFMEEAYQNNNSIKYYFDIHRDAGSHEYTTLCISEKCYAKILFLIGLENPNYMENQKYAEKLSKMINDEVKGLSKGILQKKGKKVNGIYNQDFSPRAILIEIGGENNNMEEVYNTLNILSKVLIDYIKEEINYGN